MNIFQQHLINLGYTDISCFSTALECLHTASAPDIIFYDYGINFLRGQDVLKKIKSAYPDACLVFGCGLEESDAITQSLNNGAYDYFIKGENEVKSIEAILKKIYTEKQLSQKSMEVGFKKAAAFS
jgi:DNA-binding NarL/FixJ family response regulator